MQSERILSRVIEQAEARQRIKEVKSPQVMRANRMIRDYIQRKRRVCYGGLAMNNLLPPSKRFYSPLEMPDYDFLTPDMSDVEELETELKAAGFGDVYITMGIHENTWKVYVDYVAQADITVVSKKAYDVFYRRSVVRDGIHYTDPDILRMMMYLELSRPKGQVERWKKVYSRVKLLNDAFPIPSTLVEKKPYVSADIRQAINEYAILKKYILCSPDLIKSYEKGLRGDVSHFPKQEGTAAIVITTEIDGDRETIPSLLAGFGRVSVREHAEIKELVPRLIEIRVDGALVCLLVDSVACHSYFWLETWDDKWVIIGSFELMITLYLSLIIFTDLGGELFGRSPMHYVGWFIKMAHRSLVDKKSEFARFSLDCKGHQEGFRDLMAAKVERMKGVKGRGTTRRQNRGLRLRRGTRRAI
jgi:hypothetical protein